MNGKHMNGFHANGFQYALDTRMGTLYLLATDRGLSGLYWERRDAPLVRDPDPTHPAQAMLMRASGQIAEYMAGKRKVFDLALDVSGTPFQEKVWEALRVIPFGATLSYKDLAGRIGKPDAIRAVGTACGKNPVCLVIPCHRIIATGGGLGGYAGGLPAKRSLLELEGWGR